MIDTPHMDQLSTEAVVFNRAYVTSAICTPSRASIFLSQFERRHEVFRGADADTQLEIILEGAMDFLDAAHTQPRAWTNRRGRPEARPFVLSITTNLPHTNGIASMQQRSTDDEIYRSLYRDRGMPLPPNYIAKEDIVEPRPPPWVLNAAERQPIHEYGEVAMDSAP